MTYIILVPIFAACLNLVTSADSLCNTFCSCNKGLTELDCSRSYLSIVIPVTDWPENVEKLDLSANNISELNVEVTHPKLKVFDLSHNRIKSTVQSAFGGLTNLEYLNLANNLIKKFEENAFYGLDNLKALNVSHNELEILPDKLFFNLVSLEQLSLGGNPLAHLYPIYFTRLANLKWLDVSDTGLYSLPADIFHVPVNLEFLDLTANEFHEVPTNGLRSARNLKHLRLNENYFEGLDKKSFIKLASLEILELSFMENLQYVGQATFSDLEALRVLDMKYNPNLRTINTFAFEGLFNQSIPVLQEVDLERNKLSILDSNTFDCASIRKFNVQKNPWKCDCYFRWIKDCSLQRAYLADLKCSYPEELANSLVQDVDNSDFKCPYLENQAEEIAHLEKVHKSLAIGIAVFFVAVLSLGIALVFKWGDIKTWYRSRREGQEAVYYVRTNRA